MKNETAHGRSILRLLPALVVIVMGAVGCTSSKASRGPTPSAAPPRFSHEAFDRVLRRFVDPGGLVDYASLEMEQGELDRYFRLIAAFSPDTHPQLFPTEEAQLAYWINGYNAATIKTVLHYYPIESVLNVRRPMLLFFFPGKAGFFYFQRSSFGGKRLSLYHLEEKIIRERFEEPRIHFALNCASKGCPVLPRHAFSAEDLDAELDREARKFLAETRNLRVDHDERAIYLSEIFSWYEDELLDWYRSEFPGREASLVAYVELYATADRAKELRSSAAGYAVRFTPYDWRLNDRSLAN